ncbi:hypothetical protein [Actinacidiphila oryziradicis]|uniref:Uncharacterized protein n=1 Tax=Actinacidiphila oryziradicis TaxID=2571141 RepID=A0A4U0RE74_9ACTN|nr:hypothetical protein [Actinacidiphila oryziradicis]TJZ93689.1 hypothetical protein FCI23_54140 [Actinacidiphila oryziradicis]
MEYVVALATVEGVLASLAKLCLTQKFELDSSDLIRGRYLTREDFEEFLRPAKGPDDSPASRLDVGTMPRYLNNSTFEALFKDGWIGARGVEQDFVTKQIAESLADCGAVVVGIHHTPNELGNSTTTRYWGW